MVTKDHKSAMKVKTIYLPTRFLEKIQDLEDRGIIVSRSEFVRAAVAEKLERMEIFEYKLDNVDYDNLPKSISLPDHGLVGNKIVKGNYLYQYRDYGHFQKWVAIEVVK